MGKSVDEILATHTSRELTEWMAYEREYGPIDNTWRDGKIAEMHELLQALVHIQSNIGSDGKSPETRPQEVVRPGDLWRDFVRRANRGEFD